MSRWADSRRNGSVLVGCAVLFVLLDVGLDLGSGPTTGWAGPYAGLALQLVIDLSVLGLARVPVLVGGLTVAASLAMLYSDAIAPGLFVPTVSLSPVTIPRATPVIIIWLVLSLDRGISYPIIAVLAVLAARPWQPSWGVTPFGLLSTLVPALGALYFSARHALLTSLRERAERAEREQRLLAEQARFQERRRMTVEMHDVVSHRVSLIVLQAGALSISAGDDAVRGAAEEIRATGAQALQELREVIGLMRKDTEGPPSLHGGHRVEPPVPHPSTLVAESESVGIGVTEFTVEGAPGDVSPTCARTVYRVVQEALTNVRKHAPGSLVRIQLSYRPDRVRVRVHNSAATDEPDPALAGSGSGSGLRGLRHRVTLVGGSLTAGAEDNGGFTVAATLPGTVPANPDQLPSTGEQTG